MNKKRVLVAHRHLKAAGGGNVVAAWALEALRESCDLSLATLYPPDYAAVNYSFGTSLRAGDFTVHLAPPRYRRLLRSLPRGGLLEQSLIARLVQNLDRRHHYDLLFGTQGRVDFGRRGMQYVHSPWIDSPPPENRTHWFHSIPGVAAGYRGLCQWIGRTTHTGWQRNLSLLNSHFTATPNREIYGAHPIILYPPVPGGFPDIPWEQRMPGFVAVGRIASSKRWEMAVAILDEVRRRGCDISFTLIGFPADPKIVRRLQALQAERPWFRILNNLSREELAAQVARHRYGIHPMKEEPFGIAPAEIQRAGGIVFVHNSGGPVEIVGGDERLLFHDVDEAAGKIVRVLREPGVEAELRRYVAGRRECFRVEEFCASLRDIVEHFE